MRKEITKKEIEKFWGSDFDSLIDQYIDRTDYRSIKDELVGDIIGMMCAHFGYEYDDRFSLEEAYEDVLFSWWHYTIVECAIQLIDELKEKQDELLLCEDEKIKCKH